jgi:ABC-type branched-subunit amino acid transport system substrate-binding protein
LEPRLKGALVRMLSAQRSLHAFLTTVKRSVSPETVYAAAATEALLDAIAASDGTRASVSRQLMRARHQSSLIGPYAIDAKGDPDPAPISVFRLERPGGSTAIEDEGGGRLLAPILPPRRLWATSG